MIPPPPRSTLFPYTTLFRSFDHRRIRGIFLSHMHGDHHGGLTQVVKDRKSTRLNSSHQIISYAVFCLKKKKYIISFDYRDLRLDLIDPITTLHLSLSPSLNF